MKYPKVLLVEDDDSTLLGYSRFLSSKGYSLKSANTLAATKQLLMAESFDAILLDLHLPDGCSLPLIKEVRQTSEYTSIIVISGTSEIPVAVDAIRLGAFNYLTKPIDMDTLDLSLKNGLGIEDLRRREVMHKRTQHAGLRPFFGISSEIEKTVEYANVASVNDSIILLLGETGTGKGVLARWIHEHSSRKAGNYVELNCSSLKGELLRSELYGHAKGSFTSAIKDRDGLIEIADGGTLFLDEIGDMDAEVQAELLKTIEEKTFRRIGENRIRSSNFRLVCATNKNLSVESGSGKFRSDLYYRICVFPIEMPPLRKRVKDIPGLLMHILNGFGYDQFPLDIALIEVLCQYSWPGNIRELRNMVERAVLLAQGKPLSVDHFPGLQICKEQVLERVIPNNWNLETIEKDHIVKALRHFGDKGDASKALGISLSSLYRKMESYKGPMPVS